MRQVIALTHSLILTFVLDLPTIYKWRRISVRYPETNSKMRTEHVWLLTVQGKLCRIYLEICVFYNLHKEYDVFSTVHHSIELFHQPTLMHCFLYSLTICLLHYYPRYVSSINMPIFRRKNCIHTASGIFALCKSLHSTLVESGVRSQPVYCADVYRERRYQMLCEYNFSSWRWAC